MTDYILDTVHRLQKKLHTKDPFEAAKNLGIHVLYRNLNNLKGFYTLRCRERYIVINESLSQNEQKIVCAHELGHDRLHRHFAQYTPLQDMMIYDMTLKPEREPISSPPNFCFPTATFWTMPIKRWNSSPAFLAWTSVISN